MEQKQLDEIDESFFGEEFVEEEPLSLEELETIDTEPKAVKKPAKKTTAKRSMTKKKATLKKEEKKKVEIKEEPEEVKKEEVEIKPAKEVEEPVPEPWKEEKKEEGSGLFNETSTWKALTGIAVILLIFSVYSQGFNFSTDGNVLTGATVLSLTDAERTALEYVNTNLLQAPFEAVLESSADVGSLYRVTLSVAGQSVDSYLTKDGELFFPQGFEINGEFPDIPDVNTVPSVQVSLDDDPVLGNPNAPVTIVEFSDFQCPFCARFFEEALPLIKENYIKTGKVKLVYRDYPLNFHPEAEPAALASECAHEQDMYWEYHDLLFENQGLLSDVNYKKWARELGLDTEQFNDCLDSKKYLDEVNSDLADGQEAGVSGTPGFFVNGKLISGAQPFSVFEQEIELALATGNKPVDLPDEPTVPKVTANTVTLDLDAKRWLFTPSELSVEKGTKVTLELTPVDLDFIFSIPGLGVEEEVSGKTSVTFTADEAGSYEFKCGSCEDWRGMTGTLTVK